MITDTQLMPKPLQYAILLSFEIPFVQFLVIKFKGFLGTYVVKVIYQQINLIEVAITV